MNSGRPPCGFIMLPVVVALTLLATVVYLMSRDAGMGASLAGRGLDADAARYVTEAGLARMNYQAQTSNCTGYGSLTNVTFGSDSFSANSSPTSGSPVTLTATGTTAGGATTTLTRSNVTVHQSTSTVLVLQPGPDGDDAYVDSGQGSNNFGLQGNLQLRHTGPSRRALMRFDVSAIPAGARVQSAQLGLYANNSSISGDTLTAYRVTRAWTEGTNAPGSGATWLKADGSVNWTSGGGDYDGDSGIVTTLVGSGWNSLDLTQHVADWVAGSHPNYGMLLRGSSSMNNGDFKSGDDSNASFRPKLTVTFFPPCGWFPSVKDAGLSEDKNSDNFGGSKTVQLFMADKESRIIAQFDLSSIPPGTTIASAKLRFYVASMSQRSGLPMQLNAHALTRSWIEGTMNGSGSDGVTYDKYDGNNNWTTYGGDYSAPIAGSVTLSASFASGWFEIPVTALARQWIDGGTANRGVIVLPLATDKFTISMREAVGNRPELVITY